ncbi:MAG: ATP-binding protein [Chlorobiaceae bacterium]
MSDNTIGTFSTEEMRREYDSAFSNAVVESIPGSFSINDANGKLVWWNAYHRDEIVGKPEHEMPYTNALDVFHPDDKAYALESMQKILSFGVEVTSEGRVLLRGGPKFQWRMITGRRIMVNGNPFVIAIGIDITERKRFEAITAFRLRLLNMESHSVEELLRATLDEAKCLTESSTGFCHIIAEDPTIPSSRIFSSSMHIKTPSLEDKGPYSSLTEEEMLADLVRGRNGVIYNTSSTPSNLRNKPDFYAETHRRVFIPLIRGEEVAAIFCVGDKPYDYDEDDLRMVDALANLVWAIVARKRAEQSEQKIQAVLLQAQKMELVGQLAGGIAHEFNNMLGIILGNVEMAISMRPIEDPMLNNLKIILKALEQSADLTRQLLAFSQKQAVMPIVLDLNTMVERMLPFLRRLIGENISLVWIPERHRIFIKIDPYQIDLILGNLCVNSRDAISGIGKIIIKTEAVHVDKAECIAGHPCKKPGSYVTLVVTDNGSGIDKKDLPHIFEPFFTTKGEGRGTGMGLSTVYGIVKQNSSFIDCRSERDQGSCFTIYLPRHTGYEDLEEREIPPPISHRKETILLVEDEPDILNICKFTLENNGYTVLNAATPGEAISIAGKQNGQIHLLLTDVVLPEMNGCDLSKKLLSLYPDLRTLFMSGYTTDIIRGHGFLDQGVNFIQKPFSINTLLSALQNIFVTR